MVLAGSTVCGQEDRGLVEEAALAQHRLDLLHAVPKGGLGVQGGKAVVLHVGNVRCQLDAAATTNAP